MLSLSAIIPSMLDAKIDEPKYTAKEYMLHQRVRKMWPSNFIWPYQISNAMNSFFNELQFWGFSGSSAIASALFCLSCRIRRPHHVPVVYQSTNTIPSEVFFGVRMFVPCVVVRRREVSPCPSATVFTACRASRSRF